MTTFNSPSVNSPIEGLLFDMGDVLYDATAWRRWLIQLLSKMGMHTTYRAFYRIWDLDFLSSVHRGQRDYREAFQSFLRSAGLTRGQIEEIEAASVARKRELESNVRPLPLVRCTLQRLAEKGIVLGVLSDSESSGERLRQKLRDLGLCAEFSAVVSSFDLRTTKPDPVCYRAALEGMGLSAEQVAFVGHDAEELTGAQEIGMRTIAFNYDADAIADYYMKRFDELVDLTEGLGLLPNRYLGAA